MSISPVHPAATVFHAPLNTTFHGIKHAVSNDIHHLEQFRGVKYATIPARFRRSRLVSSYPEHVDASKYGPIAPQQRIKDVDKSLYGLSPGQYPIESFEQSEFDCLNLNITAPAHLSPESNLPVMVWVHGGGNVGGAGSRWLLDGGNLVRRSMEVGHPMIMVAINYRLGLFGFAASPEIAEDNANAGDKGVGNYALHDQLNALRWIHRHIAPFGGDPTRITVCGQGKGAVDVHALLLAGLGHESHLVYRAILQSGTCPPPSTFPNKSLQGAELLRVCKSLGIRPDEDGKYLDKLKEVGVEDLVGATNGVRISPTNDGVFFRPALESLASSGGGMGSKNMDPPDHLGLGIDAILLGDTYTEATPYVDVARRWTSNSLTRRLRAVLRSPYKCDAVMRAFEVVDDEKGGMDDHWAGGIGWEHGGGEAEFAERVGELIGDCLIGYGVERLANKLAGPTSNLLPSSVDQVSTNNEAPATDCSQKHPNYHRTKVFRYLFDQPSPFNSTAHHTVDLVYLFGNIDFDKCCSSEPSSHSSSSSASASSDSDGEVDKYGFGVGDGDGDGEGFDFRDVEHDGYQSPQSWGWGADNGGAGGANGGYYGEKKVCQTMQRKWIQFVWGKEPWGEYKPILPAPPQPHSAEGSPAIGTAGGKGLELEGMTGINGNGNGNGGIHHFQPPQHLLGEELKDGFSPSTKGKHLPYHEPLPQDSEHHHHHHHHRESTHTHIVCEGADGTKILVQPPPPAAAPTSPTVESVEASPQQQQQIESEAQIFVFGPMGDTYAAPVSQLPDHRRLDKWREAFDDIDIPLGSPAGGSACSSSGSGGGSDGGYMSAAGSPATYVVESPGFRTGPLALEFKEIVRIGAELANGPAEWGRRR